VKPCARTCCFLLVLGVAAWPSYVRSQTSPELPVVQVTADNVGPRVLEPLTKDSIAHNYADAWRAMAVAMNTNQADLLDASFVGFAKDKLEQVIAEQKKLGIHTRYVDRGHKVDITFYSPEGLSIELLDTARYNLQVLDGDRVVHTEEVTARYVVLMTPTEVRWKVRVLQAAPDSSLARIPGHSQPTARLAIVVMEMKIT
jgi:hypothetical protein